MLRNSTRRIQAQQGNSRNLAYNWVHRPRVFVLCHCWHRMTNFVGGRTMQATVSMMNVRIFCDVAGDSVQEQFFYNSPMFSIIFAPFKRYSAHYFIINSSIPFWSECKLL